MLKPLTTAVDMLRSRIPLPPELTKNRRELTNKRILSSLKKLGVATQAEVRLLQSRIEKLEAALQALEADK